MDLYLDALFRETESFSALYGETLSTLYFGGGTPSVFGGKRIAETLSFIRERYDIARDAEITVECNPSSIDERLIIELAKAGVNRISMGVQSAVEGERRAIGRVSTPAQAKRALGICREYGINNLSLDLMLGLPGQTSESLKRSVDFLVSSGAKHISAYMLAVEEGTPLFDRRNKLDLPCDDETADLYLETVRLLSEYGLVQYEVSNFSLPGFESRHNLKYWRCEDYIGVGPSAHSFLNGRRFYYPADIDAFIEGSKPIDDGAGGGEEEFIMLALRLAEGLDDKAFFSRYGKHIPSAAFDRAREFEQHGLANVKDKNISLTAKGFLVSNSLIAEMIDAFGVNF